MNNWLTIAILLNFVIGVIALRIAKRNPKYFGAISEITDFTFAAILDPFLWVVSFVLWSLWPLVLLAGFFAPTLQLPEALRKQPDIESEIGAIAECITELRPSGKILLKGRTRDATSLNQFISKGVPVKIVGVSGFNLVVQELEATNGHRT